MGKGELEKVETTTEHLDAAIGSGDVVDVDNYDGIHLNAILVYLSISFLSFATILILLGSGGLASAIATAVGGSSETVWLSQAIAILTAVMSPPCSQAADYWGRKWILVMSALFNFAGCIITARCTTMGMAIVGQVICGVGFGSQPLLYAVVSEILPRRARATAQAGLMCSISLGAIISLPMSSLLVKNYHEGFRIYYYIVGGIVGLSAAPCAFLYNPAPRPLQVALSFRQKLSKLDWVGYFFLVAGLVLFSIALTWSQNPYSWKDAHILAPFTLGLFLLTCLIIYEMKFITNGMFDHDLFKKDRNLAIALWCIFVEGMMFFACNMFFGLEVAVLWESDPVLVGMRFDIAFCTSAIVCLGISYYATVAKDIRRPIIMAFFSFMVFNILMATLTLPNSNATWGYPVLLGVGLSLCLICLMTAAQLSAPPSLIAITSGLMTGARSLGGSITLPIYKAIFSSQMGANLGPKIAGNVLPLGLSEKYIPQFVDAIFNQNQTELASIPGVTPIIIDAGILGLREAYLASFRYIWVMAAGLAFVAFISAFFLKNPTEDLNMHVDAPLENRAHHQSPTSVS